MMLCTLALVACCADASGTPLRSSLAGMPIPSVGPLGSHPWRNDSLNIALVAAWNEYLALTPLSREYSGAISDAPPVSLDWDVGADMPIGWKNGVACRFGDQVVLTGGVYESSAVWLAKYDILPGFNLSTSPSTAPALLYDIKRKTWTPIKSPPFVPGRTQGACSDTPGAEAMFVVSGGYDKIPCDDTVKNDTACQRVCCHPGCGNQMGCTVKVTCHTQPGCRPIGGNVTRLTRSAAGEWNWAILPPLPAGAARDGGVAGLVDDEWLVVTGGSNAEEGTETATSHLNVGGLDPPDVSTAVPGYRLQLKREGGVLTAVGGWVKMAPHPSDYQTTHGVTLLVGGVLGRSWYQFGGQSVDANRTAAFNAITHVCDGVVGCSVFPHTDSDGGLFLSRDAYRYDVDTDTWTKIAMLPQAVVGGGQQAVAIDDRHLLLMGSSQQDSFRVGKSLWEHKATRAKYCESGVCCISLGHYLFVHICIR
jgi:hypothetical protein